MQPELRELPGRMALRERRALMALRGQPELLGLPGRTALRELLALMA
ncbi:hypothetical protein PAT3040_06373 [Paenibacillus agaridevorans]|uniref:Uncharacterized protein n=1 Tax=Paenibacillus agaridevorans TaxID=171404 RepID=A0A2R5EXZ7_9BACL|nr:hypothetical protein PAT3040_06373 [Paenibacillus agaridevorans]